MKIPHFRWWIVGLLAMTTALSYMDRQNLPVVIGEIKKSIPITDRDYARLQSLFLVAYGVSVKECIGDPRPLPRSLGDLLNLSPTSSLSAMPSDGQRNLNACRQGHGG